MRGTWASEMKPDGHHRLLLDVSSLGYRSYFALRDVVHAPDGSSVGAVVGYLDMVTRLIVSRRPDEVDPRVRPRLAPHGPDPALRGLQGEPARRTGGPDHPVRAAAPRAGSDGDAPGAGADVGGGGRDRRVGGRRERRRPVRDGLRRSRPDPAGARPRRSGCCSRCAASRSCSSSTRRPCWRSTASRRRATRSSRSCAAIRRTSCRACKGSARRRRSRWSRRTRSLDELLADAAGDTPRDGPLEREARAPRPPARGRGLPGGDAQAGADRGRLRRSRSGPVPATTPRSGRSRRSTACAARSFGCWQRSTAPHRRSRPPRRGARRRGYAVSVQVVLVACRVTWRTDVTQDERKTAPPPPRPDCPFCGSTKTEPFTHAGPGARVNMKCTHCGHLFHAKIVRS